MTMKTINFNLLSIIMETTNYCDYAARVERYWSVTSMHLDWHTTLVRFRNKNGKDLTCYSKAPFVKFYSVIHKMCYNLHGSAFGLDYTAAG